MVERLHRKLKESLRAAPSASSTWTSLLPWVSLGIRTTPRDELGVSSYEATFGVAATLPGVVLQRPEAVVEEVLPILRNQSALPVRPPPPLKSFPLPPGTRYVFVREDAVKKDPLQPTYRGPYRVIRQLRSTVRLQIGDTEDTVSAARVKPCTSSDPEPAVPPRRGRPPGWG